MICTTTDECLIAGEFFDEGMPMHLLVKVKSS